MHIKTRLAQKLLDLYAAAAAAVTTISSSISPLLLLPVLYKIHFKSISITKYKLHFQIVFQILFSITFEK